MRALLVRELKELAGFWVVAILIAVALFTRNSETTDTVFQLLVVPNPDYLAVVMASSILIGALLGFVSFAREHWAGTREYLIHRGVSAKRICIAKLLACALTVQLLWTIPLCLWTLWMYAYSPIRNWVSFERVMEAGLVATVAWPSIGIGAYFASFLATSRPWKFIVLLMTLFGLFICYLGLNYLPVEPLGLRRVTFLALNAALAFSLCNGVSAGWMRSGDPDFHIKGRFQWALAICVLFSAGIGWAYADWILESETSAAASTEVPILYLAPNGTVHCGHQILQHSTGSPLLPGEQVKDRDQEWDQLDVIVGQSSLALDEQEATQLSGRYSGFVVWSASRPFNTEHRINWFHPEVGSTLVTRRVAGSMRWGNDGLMPNSPLLMAYCDVERSRLRVSLLRGDSESRLGGPLDSLNQIEFGTDGIREWDLALPSGRFSSQIELCLLNDLSPTGAAGLVINDAERGELWFADLSSGSILEVDQPDSGQIRGLWANRKVDELFGWTDDDVEWEWSGTGWEVVEAPPEDGRVLAQVRYSKINDEFDIEVLGWAKWSPRVKVVERSRRQEIVDVCLTASGESGWYFASLNMLCVALAPPVAMWSSFDVERDWGATGRHPFDSGSLKVSNPWPLLSLNALAALLLGLFSVRRLRVTKTRKRMWFAACMIFGPVGYACARLFEPKSP